MSDYSTVPPPSSGAPGGGGGGGGAVNDAFKDALQRARQVCITSPEGIFPPTPDWLLRLPSRPLASLIHLSASFAKGEKPKAHLHIAEELRATSPFEGLGWLFFWAAFFRTRLFFFFFWSYKKRGRPNRLVSIMLPLSGGRRRRRDKKGLG